jgi:hypothetical protein
MTFRQYAANTRCNAAVEWRARCCQTRASLQNMGSDYCKTADRVNRLGRPVDERTGRMHRGRLACPCRRWPSPRGELVCAERRNHMIQPDQQEYCDGRDRACCRYGTPGRQRPERIKVFWFFFLKEHSFFNRPSA